MLDIAGGSGIYAACIKSRFPRMKAAVLEKPPVDKIAKINTEKRNMDVEIIAADMFKDVFPGGCDIHLYSHVLHDWGMEENRKLIRKSYQALNKGGVIVIHGAHINREKNGPLSVAEYSVFIMFATVGKCYSIVEMEDLLLSEGFVDIQYQDTIGNRSIITGIKSRAQPS